MKVMNLSFDFMQELKGQFDSEKVFFSTVGFWASRRAEAAMCGNEFFSAPTTIVFGVASPDEFVRKYGDEQCSFEDAKEITDYLVSASKLKSLNTDFEVILNEDGFVDYVIYIRGRDEIKDKALELLQKERQSISDEMLNVVLECLK